MSKAPKFPFSDDDFRVMLLDAVRFYWAVRLGQANRQKRHGVRDSGTRGEVTGGRQLDAFGKLLVQVAKAAGYRSEEIFFRTPLPIPGYYRPQKNWDFAVLRGNRLVAAAEFKSQSGSFGNNFNNRSEEVIGLARDFWVAYREKVFGVSPQPWLGYLFLLEESEASSRTIALHPSKLPAMEKFAATSYCDRYRILCETLVLERDFSSAALILSKRPARISDVVFSDPMAEFSALAFCRSLFAHLVSSADA